MPFLLSGCAGKKVQFAPPTAYYFGDEDWDDIYAELNARAPDDPIQTLHSQWKIVLDDPIEGKTGFRASVYLSRPDKVRFRATKITQTVMDMLVSGPIVTIHDKMNGEYYQGRAAELREHSWLLGQLNPADLGQILLVQEHLRENLASGRFREVAPESLGLAVRDNRSVLILPLNSGLSEAIIVRTDVLLVERAALYERRGLELHRLPIHIDYQEYEEVDRVFMPKSLRLVNTYTGSTISLDATDFKINPDLHPKVFELLLPRPSEVRPLSKMWDQARPDAP